MRIEPSLTAVLAADHDRTGKTYILTLEPLIEQMYADPSVKVISLSSLNDAVIKDTGFYEGVVRILYLDEQIHRSPADEERYKSQLTYLNQFQRSTVTSDSIFSVARINPMPAGQPNNGNQAGPALDHSLVQ